MQRTTTESDQGIVDHYGRDSLLPRIEEALRRAGLAEGIVEWTDLTPLDQFHVRGLAATRELAEALGIDAGCSLLDVGCGLGGPARFLAATYGCQVTGIDLSEPFIEAARMLSERSGLAGKAAFVQGDALELPFAEASFDYGWTQHVAMNIADRDRLYAAIHRVLKPAGRLAIYDIVGGDAGPPIYPVPWARVAENSFLLTPEAMRESLSSAGFDAVSWIDRTDACQAWADEMQAKQGQPPAPLGLNVVMGSDFAEMFANVARNLRDGRIRIIQAVMAKVQP